MIKTRVPLLKVGAGYALAVVTLCLAAWLVYGNMRSLLAVNRASQEYVKKREVADSLVYCILDVSNRERAICLGATADLRTFDRSVERSFAVARHLQGLERDSVQRARIDTLVALLHSKRGNLSQILATMARGNKASFYDKKMNSLHSGKDSVVIHPRTAEIAENKEVVYEVVKPKKNFFSRLADAFRSHKDDTVSITRTKHITSADSVTHHIDITNSVAGALAEIKSEEIKSKQMQKRSIARKEQAQQLVGIQIAERIGQLLENISRDEQTAMQRAVEADLNARQSIVVKIILLAVVALVMAVLLFCHVWRDICKAKTYSENLERANAETERIMKQRERLLLTITHDIKAPAASISGFVELLGEYVDDAKAKSYLDNVHSSAEHLLQLVGALLEYHQLEDGRLELHSVSFSPERLVNDCVELLRPQAREKGLKLSCNVESGAKGKMCRADAFRLRQIMDNLIGNAIKYTDSGSVTVEASIAGNLLRVSVADTGRGMTEDESRRIYDAFTRLPDAQGKEGVGLGLSITKELVSRLGGNIHLQSAKGSGSTFTVSIPVEIIDSASEDEADAAADDGKSRYACIVDGDVGSLRVLLLDDDPLQIQLLSEMLGRMSGGRTEVVACRHVAEAMEALSAAEKPDVMMMDIEMPEMNGMELIGSIDHSDMKVVAMTAHEPSIEQNLLDAGFDACLFKPIKQEVLAAVLGIDAVGSRMPVGNECCVDATFAPLLAFAEGDAEAEREILDNLRTSFVDYVEQLKRATATSAIDRAAVAKVAHKALPIAAMIGLQCVGQLKQLSPESVATLADADVVALSGQVIAGLEAAISKLA